ncbi:GDSL esterase/lipase At5g37690 [Zea mays]|uniref:GDSL esterase/lipase n=1 Tax=Zea mays TaxID=4577 RepID=A0A804R4I0_MAIZE|nr:GDSL esterase/lipase At5g37690 [Zea mays]|eukprot:XP_020399669.1 GDSL esterase/lipase At5g37690 [Zea mays]
MAAALAAMVVLALRTVAGAASTPAAAAATTSRSPVIYIFGDSMSDVGNNNYLLLSLAKCNYPWYGIDYKNGYPTGRFTNGRTIGDIMAAKFGSPPPVPFLSLYMTDDEVLGGVNFASGGAGLLNETGIYFVQYLSFDSQISSFEQIKNAMIAKIGKKAAEETINGAIFQIGLGSNDYVNNFLRPFMADGIVYTHDEFIGLLMDTIDRQLTRLYKLGARHIWFSGLAPLGCIPSQRVLSDGGGECLDDVNTYAIQFNAAAKDLLEGLNAKLPGARMYLSDCYSIVMELIDHPEKHGFKTSHTSCCDVDTTVGGLCLPTAQLCADRRDFVFWDAYHTSDAANQVIADRLFADMVGSGAVVPRNGTSPPRVVSAPAPAHASPARMP